MKEKDIKGEQLEKLNNELFGEFDLADESLIGGLGKITYTAVATYTPSGPDGSFDLDNWFEEEMNVISNG